MDVYPSLTCRDLEAAARFLERAFGLLVDERIEDDRGALRVATVGLGDGRVLLQADLPDELHGSRGYSARDPEGNLWSFGADRPGG